jgi:hypothetical protein
MPSDELWMPSENLWMPSDELWMPSDELWMPSENLWQSYKPHFYLISLTKTTSIAEKLSPKKTSSLKNEEVLHLLTNY